MLDVRFEAAIAKNNIRAALVAMYLYAGSKVFKMRPRQSASRPPIVLAAVTTGILTA